MSIHSSPLSITEKIFLSLLMGAVIIPIIICFFIPVFIIIAILGVPLNVFILSLYTNHLKRKYKDFF